MSKLDDLINKLCPYGVEYKKLGDIGTFERGRRFVHADDREDGIPCIHYGELYTHYGVWAKEVKTHINSEIKTKLRYAEKNDVIIVAAGENKIDIGVAVAWLGNEKIAIHDACYIYRHKQNPVYLSYIFRTHEYHQFLKKYVAEGKICSVSADSIAKYEIPVPPREIQDEIVRILDKFMSLETELEAELEARRKQYEYYRDLLLTFDADMEWKTLGEIATDIYRGAGIKRDQVTTEGIPCVRYGEIYTSYNIHFKDCISHTIIDNVPSPKYFEHGDILFAITGESVEDIAKSIAYMGNEKCLAGGDIVVLKHNQNPKYLSFALSTNDAIMQKGKGKVKSKVVHSSVPSISEIKIPVPDLKTQEKIATILDNFLQLTNSLPAEIEARQKQYEYYRDKLLTFKELK